MKLSQLLARRQSILRQAQLATLAHAYQVMHEIASRATRARLAGRVLLQPADPRAERYTASLTALTGHQSLIEEHFTDEDLHQLADAAVLVVEAEYSELEFSLEEMAEQFVAPLRATLEQAGVVMDDAPATPPPVRSDRSD